MKEKSIIEKVTSYESACKILKRDPKALPDVSALPTKYKKGIVSHYKLITIIEALNKGWTPDWNDESQPKYFLVFDMRDKPGFGFSYYYRWYYDSICGSPFLFKNSELCIYAAKKFKNMFKDYYLMK